METENRSAEQTEGIWVMVLPKDVENLLGISHYHEEVLRRTKKDREIINIIERRKIDNFGHIICGPKYRLLRLIAQGKV